ncbi:MAG: hypothetical protein M1831_005133 [Alyxoria varia]|nr:MAG: hypothetical protein M1831_005133 [Alyxoria varia]
MPYDPDCHVCWVGSSGGGTLCPIQDGEALHACGEVCYSRQVYSCDENLILSTKDTFAKPGLDKKLLYNGTLADSPEVSSYNDVLQNKPASNQPSPSPTLAAPYFPSSISLTITSTPAPVPATMYGYGNSEDGVTEVYQYSNGVRSTALDELHRHASEAPAATAMYVHGSDGRKTEVYELSSGVASTEIVPLHALSASPTVTASYIAATGEAEGAETWTKWIKDFSDGSRRTFINDEPYYSPFPESTPPAPTPTNMYGYGEDDGFITEVYYYPSGRRSTVYSEYNTATATPTAVYEHGGDDGLKTAVFDYISAPDSTDVATYDLEEPTPTPTAIVDYGSSDGPLTEVYEYPSGRRSIFITEPVETPGPGPAPSPTHSLIMAYSAARDREIFIYQDQNRYRSTSISQSGTPMPTQTRVPFTWPEDYTGPHKDCGRPYPGGYDPDSEDAWTFYEICDLPVPRPARTARVHGFTVFSYIGSGPTPTATRTVSGRGPTATVVVDYRWEDEY